MKRKFLIFVFLALTVVSCALGIVGCTYNYGDEHEHTFSSEWSYNEQYHWKEATCGHADVFDDYGEHIFNNGTCTVCGYERSSSGHEHELTRFAAVEPSCTENGSIEYWYCDQCDKYFSDVNGTHEVLQNDTVVVSKGHDYGQDHRCIRCQAIDPAFKVTSLDISNSSFVIAPDAGEQIAFITYPENAVYDNVTYKLTANSCGAVITEEGVLTGKTTGSVTVELTIDGETTDSAIFYVADVISTAAQFNDIRNNPDGVYILASNIDLSGYTQWEPIGSASLISGNFDYTEAFSGILEGDGYTVSGLNLNLASQSCSSLFTVGLLGSLSGEGKIFNLNLSDVTISGEAATTDYVGGIVGLNAGNVENCRVSGEVDVLGAGYVGGAVGENVGSLSKTETDMILTAKADTRQFRLYAGGVVGRSNGGRISDLSAKGTLSADGSSMLYAGGIAGALFDTIEEASVDMNIVINSSNVNIMHCYVGLLTGYSDQTINNIEVNGSMQITCNTHMYVGGVVGRSANTVNNCINNASISVSGSSGMIGGISGYADKDLAQCINNGEITVSCDYTLYAGGVTGYSVGNISSCENFGIINITKMSAGFVGGIVGQGADVSLCNNNAELTISINSSVVNIIGGVAGDIIGSAVSCTNNINADIVVSENTQGSEYQYIGGVVGRAGEKCQDLNNYAEITVNSSGECLIGNTIGKDNSTVNDA